MHGIVTPPEDLQPAIEALGPIGIKYLEDHVPIGCKVTPQLLAKAADSDRGELTNG